jgi:hypothetical protein
MAPAISAGLAAFVFGVHHLARAYTTRPACDIDAYCDEVDAYIRAGRSRLVTGPVDAGLDADLHWKGVESEWLRFVQDLPTTRGT